MKGPRLLTIIFALISILVGILMVVLNLYNSWSEHALTMEEPLLLIVLLSSSIIYLYRSTSHMKKIYVAFELFNIKVRYRHLSRIIGFCFVGIALLPSRKE